MKRGQLIRTEKDERTSGRGGWDMRASRHGRLTVSEATAFGVRKCNVLNFSMTQLSR